MTNGSSQGLFVVVAVVIFGIFVAISYSLFRDQLSPALASIFRESIEQTTLKLNKKMTTAENFENFELNSYILMGNSMIIEGYPFSGVLLSSKHLEANKNYELSFEYTDLGDTIKYLAGHLTVSTFTKVYIDGELSESDWHSTNIASPLFRKDGSKHKIRILFNTDRWENPIGNDTGNPSTDKNVYIQPNRLSSSITTEYKIKLENFKLSEI